MEAKNLCLGWKFCPCIFSQSYKKRGGKKTQKKFPLIEDFPFQTSRIRKIFTRLSSFVVNENKLLNS